MRKHGGTPSWRDKHVTPAAISPPGVAQDRFCWGPTVRSSGMKAASPLHARGLFLFVTGATPRGTKGRLSMTECTHPPPPRPPPPSQGRRPARYWGDGTPRTRGQGDPQPTNGPDRRWGGSPLKAPPRDQGVTASAPDTGTGPNAAGLPTQAATQLNRRGAEDAPQQ